MPRQGWVCNVEMQITLEINFQAMCIGFLQQFRSFILLLCFQTACLSKEDVDLVLIFDCDVIKPRSNPILKPACKLYITALVT